MRRLDRRRTPCSWIGLAGLGLVALAMQGFARADDPKSNPIVRLERADQPPLDGVIVGSKDAGFRFQAAGSGDSTPLELGWRLVFPSTDAITPLSRAPFQFLAGECMRISGMLEKLDAATIEFSVPWDARRLRAPRAALSGVSQIPGESRFFSDGFETLDSARWSVHGEPAAVPDEHVAGTRSLRIDPGSNSITHELKEPLVSARLDLAFHDPGKVLEGRRCGIELIFRGPSGLRSLKIDLGWREESLTVESVGGPALAVQRLARAPGWRGLSVRFSADSSEISVDGKLLAFGRGPTGALTAIRLGSSPADGDRARPTVDPAPFYFDDLRLVRYTEPPSSVEIDAAQDEARLIVGDQLFGVVESADSERVRMTVDARAVELPWSEVGGLYFRRIATLGAPVEGTLARVEWTSGTGADARDVDFAEGALEEVSATVVALATPYAGLLRLPRSRVRSITVQGAGRRIVFDAGSHHLGDAVSVEPPLLDPPLPEGSTLERLLELQVPVDAPSFLVLDVLQVVGEEVGLPFSELVRKGELRTYVVIGGKRIDYLNHHIKTRNDAVERIRIPIPPGNLKAGANSIRIEQTATAADPGGFDDLGVLQMALELDPGAAPAPRDGEKLNPTAAPAGSR